MVFDIPIDHILIEDRARQDFGDLEQLTKSIEKYGLLNEIIVREVRTKEGKRYKLVAGERRLRAHRQLALTHIKAKVKDELTKSEEKEIELVENYHKEMTWQEQAKLIFEIHELKQQEHGYTKKHVSGGWSMNHTAELLGLSVGTVHQAISLHDAMQALPDLKRYSSKRQALKAVNKMQEIAALEEISRRRSKDDDSDKPYILHLGDAVSVLKDKVDDETVDMVVFDPPWGIDADSHFSSRGPGGDKVNYDDTREEALRLTKILIPELFRVMRNNTHMYMFFGIELYHVWTELLRDVGFSVQVQPVMWVKEGGAFTDFDMRFMPRYEMAIFAAKGQRRISSPTSDVFMYNRPPSVTRIHTQQKPVELLRHWIKLSTVQNEIVLDPCMGSGATIVAATLESRRSIGIEKSEENFLRASDWARGSVAVPKGVDVSDSED